MGMDAAKVMISQGWRGPGHSLHHSDDTIGLTHPILVSRKQNNLGLGAKAHPTNDQWWMNEYDRQLKDMVIKKDCKGAVETIRGNKIQERHLKSKAIGGAGLYSAFVSGGSMKGTISKREFEGICSSEDGRDMKMEQMKSKECKAQRRGHKEARRQRKLERAAKRVRKAEGKVVNDHRVAGKTIARVTKVEDLPMSREKDKRRKEAEDGSTKPKAGEK